MKDTFTHEDNRFCAYRHTSPSGKVYIGITGRNPLSRWNEGRGYKQNPHFWSAIQKYGWDEFTHEILFSALSKEDACAKEIELIQVHCSNNPDYGYNHSLGGEQTFYGCHHSEETKQLMSEKAKGRQMSEETRRKLREANLGKTMSEEVRRKLSEINKGKKLSPEQCHRRSEATRKYSVRQFTLDGEFVAWFPSAKIAAECVGCDRSLIRQACNGTIKTAMGYKWKYEPI